MRRVYVLGLLLTLVACREKAPVDGAVQVSVTYGSYVPACLRVLARDGQGHEEKADILRDQFKNPEGKEVRVAVFRKPDWGRELTMEVSSYPDASAAECSGTLLEAHVSPAPITVPLGDFARFNVTLRAKDDDGDGYILKDEGVAGTDCLDTRRDVYPGAAEACSVAIDFDCDGDKGCQDADCQAKACDDDNACTTGDMCQGTGALAECKGTAVQCTQPTDVCFTRAECNPANGQCINIPAPPETPCNDNDACTDGDTCGAHAQCAGTPKACNTPPTVCHQSAGTCSAGTCQYPPKAASESCTDGDACTQDDQCNGAGVCGGTPTPCTPTNVCRKITGGCVAQGNCTEALDESKVNTTCDLGGGRSGVCRGPDGACSTFPYVPSNFDPDAIPEASIANSLTTTCTVTFDSSDGALTWTPSNCVSNPPQPQVISQGVGGPPAVVLPVRSVSLGGELILVGTRPVILAVYGNATLNQNILANGSTINSGTDTRPGAGGNQFCSGRQGNSGVFAAGEGGGGGGAGGGTAGAAGGQGSDNAATAGGAGSAGGTLSSLVGGCPGGNGGAGGGGVGGKGGAGGGAIQVSVSGSLTVSQWVTASGAGGLGGNADGEEAGGGGGGGSGGGVILEAYQLSLTDSARITANGGAGGEGSSHQGDLNGYDGADGPRSSAAAAQGGTGGTNRGGDGGNGGARGPAPTTGEPGNTSTGAGGGGGGAVGHIRLKSVHPCNFHGSSIVSPDATRDCPP